MAVLGLQPAHGRATCRWRRCSRRLAPPRCSAGAGLGAELRQAACSKWLTPIHCTALPARPPADGPGPEESRSPPPQSVDPGLVFRPPSGRRAALAQLAGVGIGTTRGSSRPCTLVHSMLHAPAGTAALSAAVLGSNFLGSTSFLLSLDGGKLAGQLKLDTFYPVNGYKRCSDVQNGYGGCSRLSTLPGLTLPQQGTLKYYTP